MTGDDRKSLRVRITGRVQGVWFRGWTKMEAAAAGLDGHVCNRADGSVEALISGPAAQVDALLVKLRHGPPAARVETLEIFPAEPPAGSGFTIQQP